jgi:hypothetical protein
MNDEPTEIALTKNGRSATQTYFSGTGTHSMALFNLP